MCMLLLISINLQTKSECLASPTPKLKFNKKLRYRRKTVQRTVIINSCCLSLGMKVKKLSNNKSDLQGRSRALTMVPFDRSHTISY